MAVVALARHNRGPRLVGAAAVLAAAAASGLGQVQAVNSETAAARADLVNNPAAHQECETVEGVAYCAYPTNDREVELWQHTVEGVKVHLPAPVDQRVLVVAQRVPWASGNSSCGQSASLDLIDGPISDRVVVGQAWLADGQVHPGIITEQLPCGGSDLKGLFTGVQVGAWAVGLPPAQSGRGETCAADGQARSAIALWLGATASGRLDTYVGAATVGSDGRVGHADWDNPPTWGVNWHPYDLAAAVAMTGMETTDVERALAEHWDELVDPATPTARLLELVDLPPSADVILNPLDTCAEVAAA